MQESYTDSIILSCMNEVETSMAAAFATALEKSKEEGSKVKELVQTIVESGPVKTNSLVNNGRKITRQYKSWTGEPIQNPKTLQEIRDNWVTFFSKLKSLQQIERLIVWKEFFNEIVDFDKEIPDKIDKRPRAYLMRQFNQNNPHFKEISKLKGFSGASPLTFALIGIVNLADLTLEETETICLQIKQAIDSEVEAFVTIADLVDSYFFQLSSSTDREFINRCS